MLTIPTYDNDFKKYGETTKDYVFNLLRAIAKEYSFHIVKDENDEFIARRMVAETTEMSYHSKFQLKFEWLPEPKCGKASFWHESNEVELDEKIRSDDFDKFGHERRIKEESSSCYVDLEEGGMATLEIDDFIAFLFRSLIRFHTDAWLTSEHVYGRGVDDEEEHDSYLHLPLSTEDYYNEALWKS